MQSNSEVLSGLVVGCRQDGMTGRLVRQQSSQEINERLEWDGQLIC
jgi:hypothetical protein